MKKTGKSLKLNISGSLSSVALSANNSRIRDRDLITCDCVHLFLNSEKAHKNRDNYKKS